MTYEDKSRDVLETNFVEVSLAPLRIIYFSEIPHAFEYLKLLCVLFKHIFMLNTLHKQL